ncbi:EAL domain-containing protein [Rhodanobacter denitrificans]|uniref:EAL domain-containing protein n=1 Tax=Rhodanobacter denitrificans TaxID=666685 RepID=A0A368KBW6_9GAMM|nr:GGDEF and EAL domain-containing protein [Rhodanobacter denitrificans]RCS28586.1 EAL domain-containing protein [Rhodanobacter denitrificans]
MRPPTPAEVLPSLPDDFEWPAHVSRGAPALLAYLDLEQRFRFANDTHRRWLGIDPQRLIGRRLIDVVGRRNHELAGAALERAYAGHMASYEGELYNGHERRYAHGNFQPDFDADGRVRGIFTALVDITERRGLELQLHESEQRFYSAFQHAAIGMALTRPDGRFLRVNAAVCQMLGYREEELLALDIAGVTHPDDLAADAELMTQLLAGERESYQLEKRNFHRDGRVVHILLSVSLVRDGQGAPLYFVLQVQDISQRKAFEDALHRERELAEVTLRSIGDAVITTDLQLRVTSLNPIAEAMTGWGGAEAQGRPIEEIFQLIDARHGHAVANPLRGAIELNTIVDLAGKALLRHRHGFDTPVEDSSAPIHDHAGNVIGGVLVFHDVSETRALALKMIHLTQHDTLTGLPNRNQLHGQVGQAIATANRRQQRAALLYIDIDNFKQVNQQHGHAVGDRVLRAFAARLHGCLPGDELLSRYGGDEFVVVLPHLDSVGEAASLCQTLINHGEQTCVEGVAELGLHLSIGISVYPDDAIEPDALLQHAETALMAVKAQGLHGYRFFTASMNERARARRRIEAALRQALSQHELDLHYQPKVKAHGGRIVGAEALLRWHVDGRELYTPDQFVPVAEDSGLILPIGAWVLRQACLQAQRWRDLGRPIPVSVNVSPLQFQHPEFYHWLDEVLEQSGLEAGLLELELTERMVMSGGDATTGLLQRIKRRGVRLSLDDFGTGYCSLSYLKHFPIDALKIDRVFVRDLASDRDTATITSAIIAMARSLGKQVIAEGVETREQAAFLRHAGCSQLQGFLFGAAVPAAAFEELLLAERAQ